MPIVHTVLWIKKLFWPNSVVICAQRVCFLVFNIICLLYVACDMLTALSFGEKLSCILQDSSVSRSITKDRLCILHFTGIKSSYGCRVRKDGMLMFVVMFNATLFLLRHADLVRCFCQLRFVWTVKPIKMFPKWLHTSDAHCWMK